MALDMGKKGCLGRDRTEFLGGTYLSGWRTHSLLKRFEQRNPQLAVDLKKLMGFWLPVPLLSSARWLRLRIAQINVQ